MGQVFGKADPNATNATLGGKVVATGTPGATDVADPNEGLSGGNIFARKAIAGALQGVGNSLQPNSAPRRLGAGFPPYRQSPAVAPDDSGGSTPPASQRPRGFPYQDYQD